MVVRKCPGTYISHGDHSLHVAMKKTYPPFLWHITFPQEEDNFSFSLYYNENLVYTFNLYYNLILKFRYFVIVGIFIYFTVKN